MTAREGKGAIERDDGKSLKDFSIANAQPDVSQCDDLRALSGAASVFAQTVIL